MQNVFASLIAFATFSVSAPAAVPCVRMSRASFPARVHTPPAPQSVAVEHPLPRFVPALHRLFSRKSRHPCGDAPAPGQSVFVRHGPPSFVPPKQSFVGNAPTVAGDACPGQNSPLAAVCDVCPVVSGLSAIGMSPTHTAQIPPAPQFAFVVHAAPGVGPA
jgi:hypothetical protein